MHPYLEIARPDHWFKNVFLLPGTALAAVFTQTSIELFWGKLIIGILSTCAIASANYVINEWIDAQFDKYHPIKKNRASVLGKVTARWVYLEYLLLLGIGFSLARLVSTPFLVTEIIFSVMGFLYNVKPFRTKDRVYLDVISESINNPIRLVLGWFIVTHSLIPPSSLLLGYWAGGAFLMSIKRYAEYRFIGKPDIAGLYRRSFKFYTETSLLVLSFFYANCSAFFLGVFLVKYRIELVLSLPGFAILFAWYLYLGIKSDSPAQKPEHIYREKGFTYYTIFLAIVVSLLFAIEIPGLNWFLENAFITQE
ncbi:UbiA prenyltransferase family protein [Oscillatoriales cyanobacterium LEGE 11467]|uniref:UbiA prenyltransferase family protein n=1 Tax=Zarconia navalis LEGE 11467 TaxID=1828826 RepID=A0A928VX27_9CYAN|nr:UbiA prenyltransferase family protein [Zarconia navalis LEGE 11467]